VLRQKTTHYDGKRAGFSLVELLIGILLLALGAVFYLGLGQQEYENAHGLRDRILAQDLCHNIFTILHHTGGNILERGTPDSEGCYFHEDPQIQDWFPPLYCEETLVKWLDDRQAYLQLCWRPKPSVPGGKNRQLIGILTCVVRWKVGQQHDRHVSFKKVLFR